jgi:hypothetical protein
MSEHQGGLGDAPVDPEYIEQMKAMAHFLDEHFNGAGVAPFQRKTCFVLMVTPFGAGGRCNYISNGTRPEVLEMLKQQVKRFESC